MLDDEELFVDENRLKSLENREKIIEVRLELKDTLWHSRATLHAFAAHCPLCLTMSHMALWGFTK
ncbi:hypothetical protein Csa_021670 [Cucumis sativus]|uniref:Uncharacterized protein n=1 Tax=Cucumis sativus TaxID=3659 RepID=A0A0A0KWQ8_CUCSA|nr:hypothetical protein Csa_021670 [Cucumis sativus]